MGAGNYVILLFFFFSESASAVACGADEHICKHCFFLLFFFPDAEFSQNGFNKKEGIEGPFFSILPASD